MTEGSFRAPRRLSYPRQAHLELSTARWWRPLLVLPLFLGLYAAFAPVFVGLCLLLARAAGLSPLTMSLQDAAGPTGLFLAEGLLTLGTPAALLSMRWAGGRRGRCAGTLISVRGRFRWSLALRGALGLVPLFALVNGITVFAAPGPFATPVVDGRLIALEAITLAMVPLQSAAEEYMFRGLPQQLLGTWLHSPLWGIILPVPLFALAHSYDAWGLVDIVVFALVTGCLAWKTGGLELPIALHVVTNLTLLVLTPWKPALSDQGAADHRLLLLSVAATILAGLCLCGWFSRRENLRFFDPLRGAGRLFSQP